MIKVYLASPFDTERRKDMNDEIASLMVSNGRYATVKGLKGLEDYDWSEIPKTRTNT